MKKWRVNLIFIVIILFGAAIISRLVYLQIIQEELYKALAQGQQKDFQLIKGERGEIFFSGGEILATNIKGRYVFVSPQEIKEKEKTARTLSQIFNLEEELILEKLKKDSLFEKIKSKITKEEEQALKEINLAGVYLGEAVFREYPQRTTASQTIGFFGGGERGQYGIEGHYDDVLQGEEGIQEFNKGFDIFLTLDYNIQFMAEKLLESAKENLNIKGGQIIVLDPNSGKILALANFPNFDPNNYSEVDFELFQNSTVQKLFEPGSAFKPITMAAALEQEKITPKTTYIDTGKVKIGEHTIDNYNERVFGKQTMTEVLEKSINTGAVFVERQLGHELFLEYIDLFGFFEPTGIDLQGEEFSENREFKKGYEINFATASYGQGIEMTPIQLVRAFCAIANGGKLVRPYIVEKIVENGTMIETQPEISSNQIISPKTASQLTAMLISVVENGFARAAKVPDYYIAGKTGTAQIPWSTLDIDKRGYSQETWQSFIGFVPAFSPRFLILIKLDNPGTKTAEYSAVPIFKELAKYIIDYLEIPPDYE
ncbi:penicillin-binding protein 2 [Patescibacteria group bacterium]|nr:penicillin-binding protein 2 [Patescibacteria group bacterium]